MDATTVICPYCKEKNPNTSLRCVTCGTKLRDVALESAVSSPVELSITTTPHRDGKTNIYYFIIGFVGCVVVNLFLFLMFRVDPTGRNVSQVSVYGALLYLKGIIPLNIVGVIVLFLVQRFMALGALAAFGIGLVAYWVLNLN